MNYGGGKAIGQGYVDELGGDGSGRGPFRGGQTGMSEEVDRMTYRRSFATAKTDLLFADPATRTVRLRTRVLPPGLVTEVADVIKFDDDYWDLTVSMMVYLQKRNDFHGAKHSVLDAFAEAGCPYVIEGVRLIPIGIT